MASQKLARPANMRSSTGGFNTVRPVNDDASFLVDHQCSAWPFHGFDDHATVSLTTDLLDDFFLVDRSRTNKPNELVFNPNINSSCGHITPPPC